MVAHQKLVAVMNRVTGPHCQLHAVVYTILRKPVCGK